MLKSCTGFCLKCYGISYTGTFYVSGITLGQDGVLTIERVKKDDEGLYECMASNVEGTVKSSAVVTVLGKSRKTPG